MHLFVLITSLVLFFINNSNALSQELPPPSVDFIEPVITPSDLGLDQEIKATDFEKNTSLPFTGTLADDDIDNTEAQTDQAFFGEESEDESTQGVPTHELELDLTVTVSFHESLLNNPAADLSLLSEPYMEIEYRVKFLLPLDIDEHKKTKEIEAEYEVKNWGSLLLNPLADCHLEIEIPEFKGELSYMLQSSYTNEESEPDIMGAFKIVFNQDNKENHFAICKDLSSGISMQTQGEQEDYLMQGIKLVEPDLNALLMESLDLAKRSSVSLQIPSTIINDTAILNDIVISGTGQLTLDPIL